MSELLSGDHPTYLRRLVRALNEDGMVDGFYSRRGFAILDKEAGHNWRCNRARLKRGVLQVRACGDHRTDAGWFTPASLEFCTPSGGTIVVSRRMGGGV